MAVNSLAGASPDMYFSIASRQLRDLPEEVSVSRFNAASHLSGLKHPLVFDLGGIPQDCYAVAMLLLRALYPSES